SPRRGDTRTPEDAAPSGLSVFIGTPLPGAGAAGLFKWTPLRGVLHHPFPLHRGGSRCFKPSDIAVSLATGASEYMTLITDRSTKSEPLFENHLQALVGLVVVGVADGMELVLGELQLGLADDRGQRGLQDHQREVLAGAGLRAAAEGAPDVRRDRLAVEVVRIEAAGVGEEVVAHGEGRVADGEPSAFGEEIAAERKRLLHPPQRAVEVGGTPAQAFPDHGFE